MKDVLLRFSICIAVFGFCLYSYLNAQNQVTELKMRIPEMGKAIKLIREENTRLAYQIDAFENPSHLLELACQPEYAHLRHPLVKDILTLPESALAAK